MVSIRPDNEELRKKGYPNLDISIHHIAKYFTKSQRVEVVNGKYKGVVGNITHIDAKYAELITNNMEKTIMVFVN